MKKILLLFIAFALIGCSIHYENGKWGTDLDIEPERELVYKNGLYYYFGKLYSGKNYEKYDNGKIKLKSQFKKGKKDGDWIWYSENGQFIRGETWDEYGLVKTTEK
jgi:antitoxin component YwqK of YwqJK toxin-antitoxin module